MICLTKKQRLKQHQKIAVLPSLICKNLECMQMNAYDKSFDENSKYINFLVKDEKIFQKKKK